MFRKTKSFAALIAVMIVVAVAAVPGQAQETFTVSVEDNFFSPEEITITVGDTIEWVSTGTANAHNVVADDGSFDSGTPTTDAFVFSVTFDEPGTYLYYCVVHGAPGGVGMAGVIIVEEADTTPTSTTTSEPPTETPTGEPPTETPTEEPPTATPTPGDGEPLEDPIPEPIALGDFRIRLETVATGLTSPTWGTFAPGCKARNVASLMFVTDQDGILWAIDVLTGEKNVFLDVSDRLVALGAFGPGSFDERGFLGVAFHPDYAENGLLYTYTSEPVNGAADFSTIPAGESANHQTVINEWQVSEPCSPASVVDPDTARELLRIDEPQFNHNAGALNFGPDGLLYIALGDGGNADDQGVGHGTGNGQDPGTILGSLLRIDPQGSNSANGQYGIPGDNPFVGVPDTVDEIFAYGLRNPFRFSFDSETGDLYTSDVGQNDIEEINLNPFDPSANSFEDQAANYGWNLKEGSFCFDPNGDDAGFVYDCDVNGELIDPIAEYDHDEGLSVIGGFVYRGSKNPQLDGHYVFGDWSRGFGEPNGRLFYLDGGEMYEFQILGQENLGYFLTSFGQDAAGEIYALANMTGTPFGDTGVVLRIAPAYFTASLNGSQEVPPVSTRARGFASFTMKNTTDLSYSLRVANIEEVFAAHIHCAPAGENGPVGVTLFGGETVSIEKGLLAAGSITGPDPENGCGWSDLGDVLTAMQDGGAYVNVHTAANPSGEIRGQIE